MHVRKGGRAQRILSDFDLPFEKTDIQLWLHLVCLFEIDDVMVVRVYPQMTRHGLSAACASAHVQLDFTAKVTGRHTKLQQYRPQTHALRERHMDYKLVVDARVRKFGRVFALVPRLDDRPGVLRDTKVQTVDASPVDTDRALQQIGETARMRVMAAHLSRSMTPKRLSELEPARSSSTEFPELLSP